MQHLSHRFNDTTIRFVLRYPGFPDPALLAAAARAVIESVEVLHSSFIATSRSCRWQVNETFHVADYFDHYRCDGDPMKVASGLALRAVAYQDVCQMQVTLVQGSDCCAVVVRISHLVVDGSDGKYLLGKLCEAYRMAEASRDLSGLEIKNGSRSAMNTYLDLSARELSSLLKMPFNVVKTNFPFADPNDHGPLRLLRRTIPADVLGRARTKGRAVGATVNDLLLTACYRSYAKVTGREGPMSISGMIDLRQHCKDGVSEGLANMAGGLSTILDYAPGVSFGRTLAEVTGQTAAAKANPLVGLDGIPLIHSAAKAIPMWLLLKATDIVYADMSLSLTNLGNIPCESLTLEGLKPTEGFFGGPLKRKPSVQIGAVSLDGTAQLTILGDFAEEDMEPLQSFLDGVAAELEAYPEEE